MRRINQSLKIIGRAKPRRHREKVADVIAETAVIWMLGDSHQLDGVVSCLFDAQQDVRGKFVEAGDFFLLAAHADMRFVNQRHVWCRRNVVLPLIRLIRPPNDGRKIHRIIILDDVGGV